MRALMELWNDYPDTWAAFERCAGQLLASKRSEDAVGDPLPVSCLFPECGEVLVGGDAWSAHVATHASAAENE